jgi:hypothetical protein
MDSELVVSDWRRLRAHSHFLSAGNRTRPARRFHSLYLWLMMAFLGLGASLLLAEGTAHVTGVQPPSGKVNDSITVTGENLGKGSVAAVLLSDEKSDYKASLVDQGADKISIKVPDVKPGDYNISIQVGNNIFIQPVRFKVEE